MATRAMTPTQVATTKPPKQERRKFLSAPGIAFLIIVTQIPFVLAIWFSFTNWNLLRPDSQGFLGWDRMWRNYERILSSPDFLTVILNTIVLTVSVVLITFVLGLGFALLLNRPFPGRALARTLLISPFLMMPVAAAVLWKNIMLDPSFGLMSFYLSLFGIRNFYALEAFPMASVIAIVSWQWTPFVMLILLAGLQSLPDSTVEAARIDGASGWAMFRHIILPHLTRFIEIALLLETIFILSEFGVIFVTTSGGPGLQTTNLPYQIFLEAFSRQNVGRASAYGIFAVILANIVILLFLRVLRNNKKEVAL
ncbi:binding-protein-dependent transport systems inner membrane component [Truepera radiovictrix DSM 17093]|uniref:Binding-protein-dependent transport systems inner membrane component n=2 Tax=Truepera TaxID=332248 RepID=D7CVS9_TRURR|nr:sugar ABC transporter permease [Truepera radiovictrix]ADI15990.1 binding-protein-dependent transport systems inner membrane component [Truepera radiovictrix DSM 17093]WMT58384.1 sugar ABC transporter permease [Truepera radiovictrix]